MKDKSRNHQKTIEWAKSTLCTNNYKMKSSEEMVQETPWSCVIKFSTDQGDLYLKQTPPNLFIETEVIRILTDKCKITTIPEIIETNKDLHCFLMKACGTLSLRTLFNGRLQPDLFIQGIRAYKAIQKATIKESNEFIQIGVPDWRLITFPDLYHRLVTDENFLGLQGVSAKQMKQLNTFQSALRAICEELAHFNIPESLNHSDYHDNNMLLDTKTHRVTIIDLGETAIDHPFFSLASCLKMILHRYSLQPHDKDYIKIKEACFDNWIESAEDLQKIICLVEKLLPLYSIFGYWRLNNSTNVTPFEKLISSRILYWVDAFIHSIPSS